MFRLDADKPVEFCDGLRRRDFLHAGSLSFLGLGLTQLAGLKALGAVDNSKSDMNCIMLMLVGGPSQLDTWDMKPNAPVEIRGPYKPVKTNAAGIEISENFPTSMIRFPETATAPFSIGRPSIVTTTRARMIIRLSRPFGILPRANCTPLGKATGLL